MKKSVFFLQVIFFSLVCHPLSYAQDPSQDVPAAAGQILNLWCESKITGNASFDPDVAIKNAIDGKPVERFTDWDRLVRRVRAIQKDTKKRASAKIWSLLALNEVKWRLSNYLIKQASLELGDTIKTNKAKQAAARMERWHDFKSVYKILTYARAVLDNSQELFNASADREDFEKLKQGMLRQIDAFEAVVKASSDVAQAWDMIREDDEERKRTKKNYEKALEEQQQVNRAVQIYRKNKRAELLAKYGLSKWAASAPQDLYQYAKDLMRK